MSDVHRERSRVITPTDGVVPPGDTVLSPRRRLPLTESVDDNDTPNGATEFLGAAIAVSGEHLHTVCVREQHPWRGEERPRKINSTATERCTSDTLTHRPRAQPVRLSLAEPSIKSDGVLFPPLFLGATLDRNIE